MLNHYTDIESRLGEPLWYDDNGTPRYDVFSPSMTGVYGAYAALALIECQACGRPYRVGMMRERGSVLPTAEDVESFHYGDPPCWAEDCAAGATMNSVPRRIIEFWRRDGEWKQGWHRDPEHEISWEGEEGWG